MIWNWKREGEKRSTLQIDEDTFAEAFQLFGPQPISGWHFLVWLRTHDKPEIWSVIRGESNESWGQSQAERAAENFLEGGTLLTRRRPLRRGLQK